MSNNCGSCKWFLRQQFVEAHNKETINAIAGACRRYAARNAEGEMLSTGYITLHNCRLWPRVWEHDWCGEYEERS